MRAISPVRLIAILAAGLLAGPTLAQPAAGLANADPASVQAGAYVLEPIHTRVLFAVSHLGFTTWYGDFSGATGSLVLDRGNPAASHVEVNLPIGSVSTTNALLDSELKGAEWFDAGKWPQAVFKSRKVTMTAPGRAVIDGELTLHGVTAPLTLEARFNGAGVDPFDKAYTVGFDAVGRLKRGDYGVSKYLPLVGDEVSLVISAAFVRKPG